MSGLDAFWEAIDVQLDLLTRATSADAVCAILRPIPGLSGDADGFFAGSGGDGSVEAALEAAGWTHVWRSSHYYYCMRAPNGDTITYIEGDIYKSNRRPLPHHEPLDAPSGASEEQSS